MEFKMLAASALAALIASAAVAVGAGSLTTVSGSMVSGLADGVSIASNAMSGALSIIGSGVSGLIFGQLGGSSAGSQIPAPSGTSRTCDNSTTIYTLTATPTSAAKVAVNLGGVAQQSGAFTLSGATVALAAICPSDTLREAKVRS